MFTVETPTQAPVDRHLVEEAEKLARMLPEVFSGFEQRVNNTKTLAYSVLSFIAQNGQKHRRGASL